jgi:eukaryotic-like serine/threonine-protein kinase
MVGKTVSHYKILEQLGGGGMGIVYKAEDSRLGRIVALKFLPPTFSSDSEAKARFIHEAKAASSLQHVNVCTIHDIDMSEDGQMFICMDFYDGESLKSKLERGPLEMKVAVALCVQVARGLAKAHEQGIVHRDIKPANIMITNDGIAKIVDFGLAKLIGQSTLTRTGATLGTFAYMSPEQVRGEEVDHRTDLWSLGVVLYESLTGGRPFWSDYQQAVFYTILNDEPKPPRQVDPSIPEPLEAIILRALAKEKAERYQSAGELAEDLEQMQAPPPAAKRPRARVLSRSEPPHPCRNRTHALLRCPLGRSPVHRSGLDRGG